MSEQDNNIDKAPNNMADFMSQAKNFVAKAKAAGKDNTAIANTIRFMYTLTQDKIKNEQAMTMTPYQEATIGLEQQRIDAEKEKNAPVTLDLSNDAPVSYDTPTTETATQPKKASFDFDSLANSIGSKSSPTQTSDMYPDLSSALAPKTTNSIAMPNLNATQPKKPGSGDLDLSGQKINMGNTSFYDALGNRTGSTFGKNY